MQVEQLIGTQDHSQISSRKTLLNQRQPVRISCDVSDETGEEIVEGGSTDRIRCIHLKTEVKYNIAQNAISACLK